MMTLTVPLLFPLVTGLGHIAVLFGILVVRMTETARVSPPVGTNVHVLSGAALDTPLISIFRGTGSFVVADIQHAALLMAFPILVPWLPSL
ncbi:TRAP transporter large permease subunit [Tropicibacter sp. S64]|uniref:TRAP transporter large permease subunit n=1 Tax=Tropicibacter sp. S64 TaxID=3415122 RepID=UPI003C7C6301